LRNEDYGRFCGQGSTLLVSFPATSGRKRQARAGNRTIRRWGRLRRFGVLVSVFAVTAALLAGCGGGKTGAAAKVAYEITQAGSVVGINGPSSIDGGVLTVTVKNSSQNPSDLELIRVTGNHSADELLKFVGSEE